MKLIRWVEVHIGRSRRKGKKEREREEEAKRGDEDSTPELSKKNTCCRSPAKERHIQKTDTPIPVRDAARRTLHIRTSFLDVSDVTNSPRQRSRIRTNPWFPSPRSSAGDSGHSSENADSVSCSGSVFGSQSSGSLWDCDGWVSLSSLRSVRDASPSVTRPLRRHIDRCRQDPEGPTPIGGSIKRSDWIYFQEATIDQLDEVDSSEVDEAYSEDYVHSEDGVEVTDFPPKPQPPDTGSPQADSACGSDPDNSSCSTTPLSETGGEVLDVNRETLHDKVQRLRSERHLVERKIREAREEEMSRRGEQLRLQQELVQYRRLLLLQTLQELRTRLEQQGDRLHRAYTATCDLHTDAQTR